MKYRKELSIMSLAIIILSLISSILGLMPGGGSPLTVTSIHGETFELFGRGIYSNDSFSYAIQAMDLALIVPAAFISGIALLKHRPIGYALGTVIVIKGITMFTAVSVMGISLYYSGIEVSPVELLIFPLSTLINLCFAYTLIRNMGHNS